MHNDSDKACDPCSHIQTKQVAVFFHARRQSGDANGALNLPHFEWYSGRVDCGGANAADPHDFIYNYNPASPFYAFHETTQENMPDAHFNDETRCQSDPCGTDEFPSATPYMASASANVQLLVCAMGVQRARNK